MKTGSKGFTLMEVLVATAITGFAIGVCMAVFAQGHSQAYRGMQAETAYRIAVRLVDTWRAQKNYPSSGGEEVELYPGWSYQVTAEPVSAKVTLPDGRHKVVETDELTMITLEIIAPDRKRSFSVSFLVPSKEVEGGAG